MTELEIGTEVKLIDVIVSTYPHNPDVKKQKAGEKLVITSISECGCFYRLNQQQRGWLASNLTVVEPDKPLTPHVHADVIRAFADGHEIQVYTRGEWWDYIIPNFREQSEYRVKPCEDTEAKKEAERWAIVKELHDPDDELVQLIKQAEALEIGQRQIAEKISKARKRSTELK